MATSYSWAFHPALSITMLPNAADQTGPTNWLDGTLGNVYSWISHFGGGGSRPGGARVLAGIVRLPDNSPAVGYPVYLYRQSDGVKIAATVSGASGEFSFDQLDTAKYFVIALDDQTDSMKAPIKDLITPALP